MVLLIVQPGNHQFQTSSKVSLGKDCDITEVQQNQDLACCRVQQQPKESVTPYQTCGEKHLSRDDEELAVALHINASREQCSLTIRKY